jgi:hypothetical protein
VRLAAVKHRGARRWVVLVLGCALPLGAAACAKKAEREDVSTSPAAVSAKAGLSEVGPQGAVADAAAATAGMPEAGALGAMPHTVGVPSPVIAENTLSGDGFAVVDLHHEFVTVTPRPAPDGMPAYAVPADVPQDALAIVPGHYDEKTLKVDSMIAGVPCKAGPIARIDREEDGSLRCYLAFDFTLAGMDVGADSRITIGPSGELRSFFLDAPQLVDGIPMEEDLVELSGPPQIAPILFRLFQAHTVQGIELAAGTLVERDARDPAHPIVSAFLTQTQTVLGTEYPAHVRLFFDPQARLTKVRGVPQLPAGPLACPETTRVTITSTDDRYPATASWQTVPQVFARRWLEGIPLTEHQGFPVVLRNYPGSPNDSYANLRPESG